MQLSKCSRMMMLLLSPVLIISNLQAQKFPLVSFESSAPIQNLNKEEIQTVRIGNIQEILKYAPNHVLIERTSTTLPQNNRGTLVLVDGKPISGYGMSNNSIDLNAIPVSAIEKVEVLKDGASAVYGSDAVSGVTNFIIRSNYDFNAISNQFETPWSNYIKELYSKTNNSYSLENNFYGGKIDFTVVPQGDYLLETRISFDHLGNVRERANRQFTEQGVMYEVKDYFGCNGQQVHKQGSYTSTYGYSFPLFDIPYKNGQPTTGYRDIAPGTAYRPYRQPYNFNTGTVDWNLRKGNWLNYDFNLPEPCKEKKDNDNNNSSLDNTFIQDDVVSPFLLFLGLSYMMEDTDGYNPFCMFGPGVNFTYMVTPKLGVGIDGAYYTGKQYMWDQSRLNLMAGAEYFPFNNMGVSDQFSISPFLYLGLSRHKQKYMNFENSLSSFSGLGGLNLSYELTPRFRVKASGAVNPVFGENNTATNGRLDLGVRFRF